MADVRSMLKQQRAARQQAKAPRQTPSVSKKRKAADDTPEERKRTRTNEGVGVPADFFDPGIAQETTPASLEEPIASPSAPRENVTQPPDPAEPALPSNADAELDAFMAEMDQTAAQAEHNSRQRNIPVYSSAVIESAPMTAAQLAAQAREEQSAQRARRDEEMENEKEDAARALEDEFDEMDGLEERVKKLREQREALRAKTIVAGAGEEEGALSALHPEANGEESESDEDGDWDDWRFRSA